METVTEAVSTAALVAIQMGMPVTILFLIGYRSYQAERRRQAERGTVTLGWRGVHPETSPPASQGSRGHCWEVKGCPLERRAACPAHQQPQLPCWQAMRLTLGRLQADCLDCERFLGSPGRGGSTGERRR